MKRGVMSNALFNKILNEVVQHSDSLRAIVLYHGGEPLLNKDFVSWIKMLRSKLPNVYIKTVSNGMLLSEEISNALIDSGLSSVEFSLDSTSPEINDYIRRNSKSSTVIDNIFKFIEINAAKNSPVEISISSTQFIPSSAEFNPINTTPSVPVWLKNTFGPSMNYKVFGAMQWPHFPSTEFSVRRFGDSSLNEIYNNNCDHVESKLTVRSDGTVVPCCYDLTSQIPLGNLITDSISQIWNSDAYNKLRKEISTSSPSGICKDCNVIKNEKTFLLSPI